MRSGLDGDQCKRQIPEIISLGKKKMNQTDKVLITDVSLKITSPLQEEINDDQIQPCMSY